MKAIIFDFSRTLYNPETKGLYDNALQCLENLSKEYTLFLVVKGEDDRRQQIHSLDIERFFKFISIKKEKSVDQFNECQNMLDSDTKWFAIGDRTRKEIKFGNECGMTTIWLKDGKFSTEDPMEKIEEPDFIIYDLDEIAEIVRSSTPSIAKKE